MWKECIAGQGSSSNLPHRLLLLKSRMKAWNTKDFENINKAFQSTLKEIPTLELLKESRALNPQKSLKLIALQSLKWKEGRVLESLWR